MASHCREKDIRSALDDLGRPALHAKMLGFEHPTTGRMLKFESDIPTDLEEVLDKLASIFKN